MVKDAEANAEADKKKKELVEVRNHAEAMIHTTEKTLKENGDKISASDKSQIEEAIKSLKSAMEADDANNIKERTDALMQASMKLGEAMYKQQAEAAQAAGAGATGPETASEQPKDDKVVDADFEEVK